MASLEEPEGSEAAPKESSNAVINRRLDPGSNSWLNEPLPLQPVLRTFSGGAHAGAVRRARLVRSSSGGVISTLPESLGGRLSQQDRTNSGVSNASSGGSLAGSPSSTSAGLLKDPSSGANRSKLKWMHESAEYLAEYVVLKGQGLTEETATPSTEAKALKEGPKTTQQKETPLFRWHTLTFIQDDLEKAFNYDNIGWDLRNFRYSMLVAAFASIIIGYIECSALSYISDDDLLGRLWLAHTAVAVVACLFALASFAPVLKRRSKLFPMMMSLGHICAGVPLSLLGCFVDFEAGLLTLVLSLLTSTAISRPRFVYNVATGVIMILLFAVIGPTIPNEHALAPSLRTPLRVLQPINYITYFSYIIMYLAAFTYTMESYLRIQFCVRWQFKMGKKAMERAKHAEGTKDAKSSFLSNITHEIRHPIVGIISSAELLAGPGNAMDAEQEEYVRGIQQQSMQLLRLINDILEYAKLEGGYFRLNPKPVIVGDIIEEVVQRHAINGFRKGLEVLMYVDLPKEPLLADSHCLEVVLNNLLDNAFKYTEAPGEVAVVGAVTHETEQAATMHISVRDTGVGIAPTTLDVIFSDFLQGEYQGKTKFSGIGLGLALVKAYVAVMDGELGVQSSQEPTASTGTGSTFWLEITLPKAREEDLYSSSSPMRMGRKNSSQRVSFEQQREGFFLGGSGSEGDGGETTAAEGGGQSGTLDERLRGGEATERPGLQEGFDGSLGGSIRRLQKEGAESPSTRVEAWQAVVANNVVHGLDSSNSESTSSKAGGLAQVNVNLPKRGAYSAPDLDRGVVKQAGELPPKENLPPEAAPQKSLFRGEEGKADPAPAVFDVAAKKPNGLVDTIVVCADPSLKVRQTVSQYLASETIHVVTGSSLRKALTGAARQAAQMRADPGRSKDARVVVVALVSSALEKPKELPQEAAELDIRWVLMCKAGDLANGLGLSGVSSLERGGSGAGSVNSGGSDGGGSTNAADLLASPTRPPRGPGKLTKRRSASQELQEQLRTLWRNAAAEQEGGGFATGSLENRALDALADQVNIDEYLDRGGEWANRGTMSAPHSRTSSLEPGPRLPLSTPHSRSGSLDGSFLASSIESSPLHPAADGAVGSPEAGASTANAGPAVQIPESIGSQLGSGTLQAGSTSAKSGGGSLTPPSGGSGYNSSVGSSGSGSVGSSGSLSSNLSGFLAERQVGERELPVFDATLEKPLRRQTLVACIQKVAGEVARKEGPEGGAPAHFTAAGERYGIMGQGSGEREAAEGAPKSVHILLVDDTMVTQMLGRRILEGGGYHVEVASNGAEALDKWEAHNYHLVLMDIEMEVMDGYTATKHIRAAEALQGRPRTPIVALTAHDSIDIEAKNMDDLLTRPVLKDALLKMVRKWTPGVGSPRMQGFTRTPPITPPGDTKVLKRWNPNAEDPIPSPITIDVGPSQVPRPSISPSNSRKMLLGDPLRTRPRGLGYSTRLARAQTDSQIVAKALPTLDVKAALMDVAEGDEEGAVEKSPSRFPRKGWSDSVVWTGHGPDMNFSPSFNKDSTEEGVHSRWRTASGLTRDTSASSPEISDENLPGLVKSPLLEYRSDWRIGSSLKFMRQSTLASSIVLLVAPYWSGWPWRNELEPPLVFAQRVACSLTSFAAAMLTLLPPDRVPWARAMRANVDLSFAIVTIVQNLFMFLLEVLDTEKMDIAVDSALNAYLGILAVNAVCQFPLSAYTSLGVATWTQVAWFIEYFLGDPAVSGLSFDVAHQEFGFPVTTAGQIMRQRDLRLVMFSSFLWLAAVTCIWTTYCSETRSADEAKLTHAVREAHDAAAKAIRAEAASKATSNLISIISHEIRTPLSSVIGMAELLQETSARMTRMQCELVRTIQQSTKQLMGIIDDLLCLSKLEDGDIPIRNAPINVRSHLEDAMMATSVAAYNKGVELAMHVDMDNVIFCSDALRLRQLMLNVLSNAIKFTDSGGEIIVTATTTPDPDGRGIILKVSCKDTGRGIKPSDLQRLFSRFEQVEQSDRKLRQQGTGLGLSIIKQLSELMGGTCGLNSEGLGKGSECWFTVRLEPAPSSKVGLKASVNLKVLVVEPRASIRRILTSYLEGWGHTCTACGTVAEARQLARGAEAAAGAWPFQAVVIDCKVVLKPGGMAFVDKVIGKKAGVVLLSPVEIEASLDMSKFAAVATKPLQHCHLYDCIEEVIHPTINRDEEVEHLLRPGSPDFHQPGLASVSSHGSLEGLSNQGSGSHPKRMRSGSDVPETSLRVLVVEDTSMIRRIIKQMISMEGHECDAAEHGQEALELMETKTYDLVFMDCQMSVMDGFTCARQIREREAGTGRHTPIIALTALAMAGDRERCMDAGMDDYVVKPIQKIQLFQMLSKWSVKKLPSPTARSSSR